MVCLVDKSYIWAQMLNVESRKYAVMKQGMNAILKRILPHISEKH